MTTEKLLPMVEATTTAIPISKTTTTIITNLSAGSHGQNKRPTIIIYPTVSPESIVIPIVSCRSFERSCTITHQTSQVDVLDDRKALRDALYQGIKLRMLKTRNSQYNTIRSTSDMDEDTK